MSLVPGVFLTITFRRIEESRFLVVIIRDRFALYRHRTTWDCSGIYQGHLSMKCGRKCQKCDMVYRQLDRRHEWWSNLWKPRPLQKRGVPPPKRSNNIQRKRFLSAILLSLGLEATFLGLQSTSTRAGKKCVFFPKNAMQKCKKRVYS